MAFRSQNVPPLTQPSTMNVYKLISGEAREEKGDILQGKQDINITHQAPGGVTSYVGSLCRVQGDTCREQSC